MGREEQVEEREVLDSIFPDEIDDISETEYQISILLDVINDDGDDSEPPTMLLRVQYPETYPDEAPILSLSAPQDAEDHTYFDIDEDQERLLSNLNETIEENMGMAMVFTLVSTLKDAAESLIGERQAAAREAHEQRILEQEREDNKRFHGTPVNPETFVEWRAGFRKELEELKELEDEAEEAAEKKKNRGKETVERLTGRQLWERGLAGKVDEEDEGDDLPEVEKLTVAT